MCIEYVLGITVAILSVLVVILIGWQIRDAVQFNRYVKKVRDTKTEMLKKLEDKSLDIESNYMFTCMAMSDYFYYEASNKDPQVNPSYKFVQYKLLALLFASRLKNTGACNDMINMLNQTIQPNLELRKIEKTDLIDIINQIQDTNKIDGFRELQTKIFGIKET